MTLGSRLKEERERLGLTQAKLGALVGAAERTVIEWEKNASSPKGHLLEVMGRLGLDAAYVVTGQRLPRVQESAARYALNQSGPQQEQEDRVPDWLVPIPRYEVRAGAGAGTQMYEIELKGTFAIRRDAMSRTFGREGDGFAAVLVTGDSMEPTLRDGDEIVIDTRMVDTRDGVYVFALDGDLRVKRLRRRMDGDLEVWSDNPAYPREIVKAESAAGLRVIGRVVWPRIR